MRMFLNAARYDWGTWVEGIWRSIVTGGTSGIISGFASMGIDPEHFNLKNSVGLHDLFVMSGAMFGAMAFVHIVLFLNTHPAPDKLASNPPPAQG